MLHTFDIAHSVGSESVRKRCFLLLAPAAWEEAHFGRRDCQSLRPPQPSISVFRFCGKGRFVSFLRPELDSSYFRLHHAGEPSDWAGRRCAQCSSWRWATLVSVASSVL